MKIDYIKTVGFRKFKDEFETKLYDITNVTGKNRAGKSNILYAIINIMLGTNLSGDEKACLINSKCDASYGELHFQDNQGISHILIRGKNRIGTKNNFLSLDGRPVTQVELTSFYKDKKLFLSILNPLYFLNKKAFEQKELVDKYLSDIKPKAIFDTLNIQIQNSLISRYYKGKIPFVELNEKEQEEFINTHILNIFMDISYDNLRKEEQNVLEGIPSDVPSYISELNQDIKNKEILINNLKGKIDYAQNIVNTEIPPRKKFEKETELTLARQEYAFLTTNQTIIDKEKQKQTVNNLEKDILNKDTEIAELEKRMKTGKKTYLEIKSGTVCNCPTCNQHIQDTSKLKTIENMKQSLTDDYNRKNLLETQKKDLESKLMIERCKYHALDGETTIEKSKQIAVVTENIKALENEEKEVEKYNNEISSKEKNIQNAKNDIFNFNKEISSHTRYIEQVKNTRKIAQKLYISYIEEKMKLAKQYLKDVDIKFYSVLKTTGEIKDDFIITYKNTPLANLSRSETIATALEFANMFNKIAKTNFPIFIDDMESCADYDFIKEYSNNSQLIVSSVEKGTPLKIADYTNSDNYTIIKPVIKGHKTINTYRNATEIKKAA